MNYNNSIVRMNLPYEWMMPDMNQISQKDIDDITFEDTIKLFLYMAFQLALTNEGWNNYYVDFLNCLGKQNDKGWPNLTFTRNYLNKRLDSLSTNSFVKTDNILLLLLQLLYIEKSKQNNNNIYTSFEKTNILDHLIDSSESSSEDSLSMDDICDFLNDHLQYYTHVYHNKMLYEYQISSTILFAIKNN